MIKKIFERWKAIKAILNGDEYFVAISKHKKTIDNVICYDYIKNTDRNLFYNFLQDYINDLSKNKANT